MTPQPFRNPDKRFDAGKWIMLGAMFVLSVLLGILFGIYPAAKASRLQPVEALRAE